jgi:hypothetical protein
MRSLRHFRPALDCLHVRIAPSTVALTPTAPVAAPLAVTTMDDTGSPGGEPSGDGSYPIIMTPPGGSTTCPVC